MLRFLFNFIFFGLIFYVISKFFPDAFSQLINWAEVLYDFLVSIGEKGVSMIKEVTRPDAAKEEAGTLFKLFFK